MIVYNMIYRGPYEYDKLILNVFQYHNLVLRIKIELEDKDCKLESLKESVDKMNDKIKKITDQMMPYKEAATTR